MRLHTIPIVALAALQVRRTISRRPPYRLQLVSILRRRSVQRSYAPRRFCWGSIVDVNVDGLIMRMSRKRLGDGGRAF